MKFDSLGLRAELLRAVQEQHYETPTPVQHEAIPAVLRGEDLLAAAQTGTGKTAGFILPILQRLMLRSPASGFRPVRALVVVPTRELAMQVGECARTYGAHLPLRSTTVFGGVGMGPQLDALRKGQDIVVATPGRLLDHVVRKTINLGQVETFVLDEADRLLDMGFIHDIRRLISALPGKRQNLLFSATFSDSIKTLADRMLNRPRRIEVALQNSAAENVSHHIYHVERDRKVELLAELIHRGGWTQTLVFSRTKHGANKIAQKLERAHLTSAAIHGNKSQSARTRALTSFKQGDVRVLVATDIAARGLDIDGLPHVVNFDLPNVPEDYVHRIGRTGRAGASGDAVSLVGAEDMPLLRAIEKLLGERLPVRELTGVEYVHKNNPRSVPAPKNAKPAARARRHDRGRGAGPVAGRTRRQKSASREHHSAS